MNWGRTNPGVRKGDSRMLVLSRNVGERIMIGEDIIITLVRTEQGKAKIGIEAPRGTVVDREEVYQQKLVNARGIKGEQPQ
jgi:carbon storage regulator